VFLPAYSPDLNPLEYIWKSIRKDISKETIESVTRLRELIRNKYAELAPSKSFAKNWMNTFGEIIKSVTNCSVDYSLIFQIIDIMEINSFKMIYPY
jgi:putative transposase